MLDEAWFDAQDALRELARLSQVKSLFMDKAWEEAFFAEKRFKEFATAAGLEISQDHLAHRVWSKSLEMEMLKQAYLRSHLVMAYGIFEKGLVSMAIRAHRILGYGEPPKRGNRSAFFYSQDILRAPCGVLKVFESEHWVKADKIREIRNTVAHSASLLDDPKDVKLLPSWQDTFTGVSTRPFGAEDSPIEQLWLETYFVGYTHDVFRDVLSGAMAELGDPI